MASKKTNGNANTKKPANNQPAKTSTLFMFVKRWWWAVLLVVVLVAGVSFFAYEKYLDRQNVADMKQLLADFEQLKTEVEAETGEKLFIEASCGSVGKFSESYSCTISFLSKDSSWNSKLTESVASNETLHLIDYGECQMLSENSTGFESNEDFYTCSIKVRGSNINTAKRIFY